MQSQHIWTESHIDAAIEALRLVSTPAEALPAISEAIGRQVTVDGLRNVLGRRKLGAPSSYCGSAECGPEGPAVPVVAPEPKPADDAIPYEQIVPLKPSPSGERIQVGVFSDLHFGSLYCSRDQIKQFVHDIYALGVRDLLAPGDLLEGNYSHARFELSHHGIDEQARDLLETIPRLPGLNIHAVAGNHEEVFAKAIGMDVGVYLERFFMANGRNDLHFYGPGRGATLNIGGCRVEMWHPGKGGPVPQLRKKLAGYAAHESPALVIAGHWHQFAHLHERGIHAIAAPTFQGGDGTYGISLGGRVAFGGMLLSWVPGPHGTLHNFGVRYMDYSGDLPARPVYDLKR